MRHLKTLSNIIIFQLEGYHEELLPGFSEAIIQAGHRLSIYTNENAFRTKGNILNESALFERINENVHFHDGEIDENLSKDYCKQIEESNADAVIFLTFYDQHIIKLAKKLYSKNIKVFAVVHNVKRTYKIEPARKLFTQGQIIPIFLSEHVQTAFQEQFKPDSASHQGFVIYNVFTPKGLRLISDDFQPIATSDSSLDISILGAINSKNFDYVNVINCAKELKRDHSNLKIRFCFPGGGHSREEIMNLIKDEKLDSHFIFSKLNKFNRCEYDDYYKMLASSDFVLCVKRANIGQGLQDVRITSSIPSGLSFRKPFIANGKVTSDYGIKKCSITGPNIHRQFTKIISLLEANRLHSRIKKMRLNSQNMAAEMMKRNQNLMKNLLG